MTREQQASALSAIINATLDEHGFEDRSGVVILFRTAAVRLAIESATKGLAPAYAEAWAVEQFRETLRTHAARLQTPLRAEPKETDAPVYSSAP